MGYYFRMTIKTDIILSSILTSLKKCPDKIAKQVQGKNERKKYNKRI